ncbi:phasin family protein [Tranquillimonas alkanivorans]|uniref:Phasin protein n=1 Tax=Tranquillimonas alkanivorans TaxID=441119 RepID=A0A1I5SJM5_9RHOB|nr:phasin family protein [Tranquillimonas alkanivorans]SFP70929.1 Phasin protein [Tranquillimonas alkanivorans]
MSTKNPWDINEMMKAFDPEQIARMWNPQMMFNMFQPPKGDMFDMESIIKSNQRNFDAMVEANKAAAEAYKDLLDKQMEIFGKLTLAARQQYEWAEDTAGPEQMTAKTKAMSEAVEEALRLMRKLAEATREANEDAFNTVRDQVNEAVDKMQKQQPPKKG